MRQAKCDKCRKWFHQADETYPYCDDCRWIVEVNRIIYKRTFRYIYVYGENLKGINGKRLGIREFI